MKTSPPNRTASPRSSGFRVTPEKFEPMRAAMLASLPRSKVGVTFDELASRTRRRLSPRQRAQYGSFSWYAKVAQLDLEAHGLAERVGSAPLRLRKAA